MKRRTTHKTATWPAGVLAASTILGLVACSGSPGARDAAGSSAPAAAPVTVGKVHSLATSSGSLIHYAEACPGPAAPGTARCHMLLRSSANGSVTPAKLPTGLGPADLQSAYSIPTAGLESPLVAIVDAYDNPNAEADLGVYRAQYGLSACTTANQCFTKVNQKGASGPLPTGNTGWGGEIDLDIQMVSAGCPTCRILLVEANSTSGPDLGAAIGTAVAMGAAAISNSWGGGEFSGEVAIDSPTFNHPGVGIFASAGDYGYGVEYPAASAFVTAVGATVLTPASNARGWTETVAPFTGSGCSQYIAKPAWQHDAGCANRTVADVAAVGENVATYDSYAPAGAAGWSTAAGTSVSSPLVAAIYAATGNAGQDGSKSYLALPGEFNDVTSGSDGTCSPAYLCTAEVGYDGPSGNGSPIGDALMLGQAGSRIAVTENLNGTLEVFYLGTDNTIYHNWQLSPGGAWYGQTALGGWAKQITVARNLNGALEVFYVGTNNAIYHNWQVGPSGGWYGETPLGGWAKQIAAAVNPNGTLEVFYVGTNYRIYHNWQISPGGAWSGEIPLGGWAKEITAAVNENGTLEVFYVGTNDAIYHNWKIGPGLAWNGEAPLGGWAKQITAAVNQNGTLEVFYVGTNDAIYHNWQLAPSGAWNGEAPLGGWAKQITAAINQNGTLEVFDVGTNYANYHNWQLAPSGAWNGEAPLGGWAKQIVAAQNLSGTLEVFYIGTNDSIYHNWQLAPSGGWSGEAPL